MPIQVDVTQRLSDIAEATFEVASEHGLGGVTIRSVAARLESSTTVITNYLPTRTDLLANALDLVNDEWIAELESVSAGLEPEQALRQVMRAAMSIDENELLRSQFWVAVLAEPRRPPAVADKLRNASLTVRRRLSELAAACGLDDGVGDSLFLFAQGVFVSAVETPSMWTADMLVSVADAVVDAFLGTRQS